MTSGTLGIIGCPILGDELIYALERDPEDKDVYVVDTGPARSFMRRLERSGIRYETMDPQDLDVLPEGLGDGFNIVVMMNRLGLHSDPKVLRRTLEEQIVLYEGKFDVIALYYGTCGNGGWDPSGWAESNAEVPVVVFRDRDGNVCDDCISVAVGGPERYLDLLKKHTGMLFITPALAADWEEYADELDLLKGFEVMDIHTLPEVFKVFGYRNSVRLDTGIGIREGLDGMFRAVEERTGLDMVAAEPGTTDLGPADGLYAQAKRILSGRVR